MERSSLRVFATVGNARSPFDRMVRLVDDALCLFGQPVTGVFQVGHCTARPTLLPSRDFLDRDQFDAEMELADVVVCHAGVGAVVAALDRGHTPVVIPRLESMSEHVNDHQLELSGMLERSGMGIVLGRTEQLATVLRQFADGSLSRRRAGEPRLRPETERLRGVLFTMGREGGPGPLRRALLAALAAMAPRSKVIG